MWPFKPNIKRLACNGDVLGLLHVARGADDRTLNEVLQELDRLPTAKALTLLRLIHMVRPRERTVGARAVTYVDGIPHQHPLHAGATDALLGLTVEISEDSGLKQSSARALEGASHVVLSELRAIAARNPDTPRGDWVSPKQAGEMRVEAVRLLGTLRDRAAVDLLVGVIQGPDGWAWVGNEAMIALTDIGDHSVIPAVRAILESNRYRDDALRCLVRLGDREGVKSHMSSIAASEYDRALRVLDWANGDPYHLWHLSRTVASEIESACLREPDGYTLANVRKHAVPRLLAFSPGCPRKHEDVKGYWECVRNLTQVAERLELPVPAGDSDLAELRQLDSTLADHVARMCSLEPDGFTPVNVRKHAVPGLCAVLAERDSRFGPAQKRVAIEELARLQDARAVPVLVESVGHTPELCEEAVCAVAAFGEETAKSALAGFIESYEWAAVAAACVLGAVDDDSTASALSRTLKDKNDRELAKTVIAVLRAMPGKESHDVAFSALARMFTSTDHWQLAETVIAALGAMPGKEPLGVLAAVLQSQSQHRCVAAGELGRMGTSDALTILATALTADKQLRETAVRILRERGWTPATEHERTAYAFATGQRDVLAVLCKEELDWLLDALGRLGQFDLPGDIVLLLGTIDRAGVVSAIARSIAHEARSGYKELWPGRLVELGDLGAAAFIQAVRSGVTDSTGKRGLVELAARGVSVEWRASVERWLQGLPDDIRSEFQAWLERAAFERQEAAALEKKVLAEQKAASERAKRREVESVESRLKQEQMYQWQRGMFLQEQAYRRQGMGSSGTTGQPASTPPPSRPDEEQ
jgi:hypothetical protein